MRARYTYGQILLGLLRVVLIVLITLGLLPFFLLLRLLSRKRDRYIASIWARIVAWILGMHLRVIGAPMTRPGGLISNHISWLDIVILARQLPIYFVSKAEVRNWPLIGQIAVLAGTEFIERRTAKAKEHERRLSERLRRGDRLLFFPEGTSSDGREVLPFKTTLFEVFFHEHATGWVQPLALAYGTGGSDLPQDFYSLYGDIGYTEHMWRVLCCSWGGRATIVYCEPMQASDYADRKAFAAEAEMRIRHAFETALQHCTGATA